MSLLLDALKNAENSNNDKKNEADDRLVGTFDHDKITPDVIPAIEPIDLAQAATEAEPKNIAQKQELEPKDSETPGISTQDNTTNLISDEPFDIASNSLVLEPCKISDSQLEKVKEEGDLQRRKSDQKEPLIEPKEKSLQWDLPPDAIDTPAPAVDDAEIIAEEAIMAEPLAITEQETKSTPQFFHYAKPLNSVNRNRILLTIFVLIGTVAGTILLYILNQAGIRHSLFSNPDAINTKNNVSQATPKASIVIKSSATVSHENLVNKTLTQVATVTIKKKPVKHLHAVPHEATMNNGKRLSSLDPIAHTSINPTASHEAHAINLDANKTSAGAFKEDQESLKLHNVIKIVKHKTSESNNSRVLRAYRLYQNGQLGKAQHLYQIALKNSDKNRDAILGLAAIAVHRNQISRARSYYKALLSLDPKDNVALTGLLSLNRDNNRTQTISIIKQLIIQKPSANLFFLLGNLYSANKRWPEAQSNYFEAWNRDNTRPDYAYNLAVSLDSLNQRSSALKYYRIALKLSSSKIARYNRNTLKRRIRDLSHQYKSGKNQ